MKAKREKRTMAADSVWVIWCRFSDCAWERHFEFQVFPTRRVAEARCLTLSRMYSLVEFEPREYKVGRVSR